MSWVIDFISDFSKLDSKLSSKSLNNEVLDPPFKFYQNQFFSAKKSNEGKGKNQKLFYKKRIQFFHSDKDIFSSLFLIDLDHFSENSMMRLQILKGSQLLSIKNKNGRISMLRLFLRINEEMRMSQQKFVIEPNNGCIQLLKQMTSKEREQLIRMIDQQSCNKEYFFKRNLPSLKAMESKIIQYLPLILENANLLPQNMSSLASISLQIKDKLQKDKQRHQSILEQINLSCWELTLKRNQSNQRSYEDAEASQQILFNQILKFCGKNLFFKEDLVLYQLITEQAIKQEKIIPRKAYILENFKQFLTFPSPKLLKQGENSFILNEICIDRYKAIQSNTILYGNLTKLRLLQVKYDYVNSISNQSHPKSKITEEQETSDVITDKKVAQSSNIKVMAIKIPKIKKEDDQQQYSKALNRIKWQRSILQRFRYRESGYILKYYTSDYRDEDINMQNCILMDYSNGTTLGTFLQLHKYTMSFSSKLNILIHIANSIRFTHSCGIVHLDINLNNILVVKNYLIKLIDFGEAYQENIKDHLHRPGTTMPFAPPEAFTQKSNFTIKQDIFSFGMLLYRLLYESYPFFINDSLDASYKEKKYFEKFYFVPENLIEQSHGKVMLLFTNLMLRCLSPNTKIRPYPEWLVIILKTIFFISR